MDTWSLSRDQCVDVSMVLGIYVSSYLCICMYIMNIIIYDHMCIYIYICVCVCIYRLYICYIDVSVCVCNVYDSVV